MRSGARHPAERVWLTAGLLVVVVVAAAGWFLVVSPELGRASSRQDATTQAHDTNAALVRHVDQLRSNSEKLAQLRAQLSAAYAALPADPDVDTFTRQLSSAAAASGVRLTAITAAPPVAVGAQAGASGAGAVPTSPGGLIYSITVSVVSSGPTAGQQRFLQRVQHGSRAVLVTSAALAPPAGNGPAASGSAATLTLGLRLFTQPQSAQDLAQLRQLLGSAAPK